MPHDKKDAVMSKHDVGFSSVSLSQISPGAESKCNVRAKTSDVAASLKLTSPNLGRFWIEGEK